VEYKSIKLGKKPGKVAYVLVIGGLGGMMMALLA